MDVKEVLRLADWMNGMMSQARADMDALRAALTNNARQGQASQPIKEHLEGLTTTLKQWDTTELSSLQVSTLRHLGALKHLGKQGAAWLNETIKDASYDMATTSRDINSAFQRITDAQDGLNSASEQLNVIGLKVDKQQESAIGRYRVAIIFREDAAINNVADLKKRTAAWHVTITGIAGAIGEKVEDTHVTGADTGSLLIFLAMTAKAAALLAIISKSITMVAHHVLDLQIKIEDLRTKQLSNATIEQGFTEQQEKLKTEAVTSVISEIEPHLDTPLDGDTRPKLERAIKNLLDFAEDGGEVDIETPDELSDEDNEALDDAVSAITAELRERVIEKRKADVALKALVNRMNETDD